MKTRKDLPTFLNDRGLLGCGVEVGVYRGDFSAHILSQWRGNTLYSVDPWTYQPRAQLDASNVSQTQQDSILYTCCEQLRKFKSRSCIVRKTSIEAAQNIENSLDFVYLDARHDYRSVIQDLKAWWPKIKSGGVFAGHDYKNSFVRKNLVEVKRAVDDFSFEFGVTVNTTTEDNLPTWYVIK